MTSGSYNRYSGGDFFIKNYYVYLSRQSLETLLLDMFLKEKKK